MHEVVRAVLDKVEKEDILYEDIDEGIDYEDFECEGTPKLLDYEKIINKIFEIEESIIKMKKSKQQGVVKAAILKERKAQLKFLKSLGE